MVPPPAVPSRSNSPQLQQLSISPASPPHENQRCHHSETINTTTPTNTNTAFNHSASLSRSSSFRDKKKDNCNAVHSLPPGWEYAYDQNGTIYYFNETTGESRWDKPQHTTAEEQDISTDLAATPAASLQREETAFTQGLHPEELRKLELDKFQKEWIRHKGFIQMKMILDKEDYTNTSNNNNNNSNPSSFSNATTTHNNNASVNKLSSWKVYYAVLSNGFLLLYKEAHAKSKKSSRTHVPVGGFDLESCHIEPAGKQDTKRKHVFIISTPKHVKLFIQAANEKEFSIWLDAIMRELIARKEKQNDDTEIMRLLKSLTFDETSMKVNRKMSEEHQHHGDENSGNKKIGNWFKQNSSNSGGSNNGAYNNARMLEHKFNTYNRQPPSSNDDDEFGGFLHMEENGDIPKVVSLCVREVEKRGLKSVGIYRLSGPASTIQKYRNAFNKKEFVSFANEPDINAVTGLLKLYFRELRHPIMTYEYYDYFMEAAKIDEYEERMYQIKSVLHSLPKPNYMVLEYLMRHLNLVASFSEENKMEASNLALIFSVGLLRSPSEDLSSIMKSDLSSKIVEAIIQQVDWFFEEDKDSYEHAATEDNSSVVGASDNYERVREDILVDVNDTKGHVDSSLSVTSSYNHNTDYISSTTPTDNDIISTITSPTYTPTVFQDASAHSYPQQPAKRSSSLSRP
ncbi:hypothetical protein BDF20DRAFT_536423 [Mycotypha africana]|uniref:uncharacterized protein n=1 Tax=Mycotypha africana TaxID=64632 RepID=UPI0022FFD710|nr:uncharacterized protein BDF20DRAFT_536423 [Mycotypha africana]KAI8979856.1 hypothetical protein BDF20DRAFT_536423 [Mycotypha africana]